MEWFKFDHDWVLQEEEMTYYKHLKDIGSYVTISIVDPPPVDTTDLKTNFVELGVSVEIRLPALAFNMYYCYTIDERVREEHCQKIEKVGVTSFTSPVQMNEYKAGTHSIASNLMILRSELLSSFCVGRNEVDCNRYRGGMKKYPLREDLVPISVDVLEIDFLPLSNEL